MDKGKERVMEVVVYALIGMMVLLLLTVLAKWLFMPESSDQNLLIMVAQAVIGMCSGVAGYFLGSSDGSRRKDALLTLTKGSKEDES